MYVSGTSVTVMVVRVVSISGNIIVVTCVAFVMALVGCNGSNGSPCPDIDTLGAPVESAIAMTSGRRFILAVPGVYGVWGLAEQERWNAMECVVYQPPNGGWGYQGIFAGVRMQARKGRSVGVLTHVVLSVRARVHVCARANAHVRSGSARSAHVRPQGLPSGYPGVHNAP